MKLKKSWIVVRFRQNEIKLFEQNLKNQKFNFYIPKFTKKVNSKKDKVMTLFPGYGFIQRTDKGFGAIRYTRGLLSLVKFGENYAFIEDKIILSLKELEKVSQNKPIENVFSVGEEISIESGPFKDYIAKITSLPSKDRVMIMMSLLGSKKNITLSIGLIKKKNT